MDSKYMKPISDDIWIKLKSAINDIGSEDPDIMDRVRKMEYFINRYRRRYNLPDIKLSKEMYCWITDDHNSKIDDLKITLPSSNLEVSMKYGIFTGGRSHKSWIWMNGLIRGIRDRYDSLDIRGTRSKFTSIDEFNHPVQPIMSKISTNVVHWHKPLMEYAINYMKEHYPLNLFYIDSNPIAHALYGAMINDVTILASIDDTPYENSKKHYGVDYLSDFKIKLSYLTPPTFDMLDNKKKRRNNNG